MKVRLQSWYDRLFSPIEPIKSGLYPYQSPVDVDPPYRLHLRVEESGDAILVVNASTVLHLNQTAAEYVYHYLRGTTETEIGRIISQRYKVSTDEAIADFRDLRDRIQALITTPDLDPVTFLDFDRTQVYSRTSSAPYRLDCAITYQVEGTSLEGVSPVERAKTELTTDEWKAVLDKAAKAGIPQIIFTGGEPILRLDLVELISYAEQLGLVTGLLTGGSKLSDLSYLDPILQAGLDHVMIILNPIDETAWQALQVVLDADIFASVHLTLTSANAGVVSDILDRLKEMGVKAVSLSAADSDLDAVIHNSREKIAELDMALIWDLPVPYSALNPVSLELQAQGQLPEGAGRAWLYVEPDGDVLPSQGGTYVLGNLLRDSWASVWDHARSLS